MSTYYPSGLLQLHIRLEEGIGSLPDGALQALRGVLAPGQTHQLGLEAFAPPADGMSHITAIVPANVEHTRNSHRQADTLTFRIAFQDFPLPPRIVRALGIVWFAGTVAPWDHMEGMRRMTTSGGTNSAIVRPTRSSMRFVGFADDVTEDHRAGQIVVSGRDYTGILLDTRVPVDTLKTLEIHAPLDMVLRFLLQGMPGGVARGLNMRVDHWVEEKTGALLPLPKVDELFPAKMRTRRGKTARLFASYGGEDVSYWDLITDLCVRAGMIPIIEEDTLVVTTARNLLARTGPGSFQRTVGADATGAGGETLTVRRMIYGYNLGELTFTRKFGRVTTPSVVVHSWAPGLRTPLVAQYPPPRPTSSKRRATHVSPSGRGASEKFETIIVRGITDQGQLERIAAGIYEEMGRSEFGGTMETKNLASFGGSNADPDLLDLRSGDPLEVVIQQGGTLTGLANYLTQFKPSEMVGRLVGRGFSITVAQSIVNLYQEHRALQTIFRTRDATFRWSLGGDSPSVSVGNSFGTYLEVRSPRTAAERSALDSADPSAPSEVIA